MRRAQQERDVADRLVGQEGEPLRVDHEDLLPVEPGNGDVILGEQPVLRIVFLLRERVLVEKLRHLTPPPLRILYTGRPRYLRRKSSVKTGEPLTEGVFSVPIPLLLG